MPEEFEPDVAAWEEGGSSEVYGCDYALVLVALVDVGAHAPVEDVVLEEGERFGGEGLGGAAEVGGFGGVYTSEADGDLR